MGGKSLSHPSTIHHSDFLPNLSFFIWLQVCKVKVAIQFPDTFLRVPFDDDLLGFVEDNQFELFLRIISCPKDFSKTVIKVSSWTARYRVRSGAVSSKYSDIRNIALGRFGGLQCQSNH